MKGALVLLALSLTAACDRSETKPAAAVSASAAPAVVPSGSAAPRPKSKAETPVEPEETSPLKLTSISGQSDGSLIGETSGGDRVRVILATQAAPLAPEAPTAWAAVAGLVAPDARVPTDLRLIPLAELAHAAKGPRAKRAVRDHARVLADGTVTAALLHLPKEKLRRVDLGDASDGNITGRWETKLMTTEAPKDDDARLLASYQSLLAVDYLVENLIRGPVLFDEGAGRILGVEDNDVFSAKGVDGRVGDPLARLSRHLHWSKRLVDALRALGREKLEAALRSPRGTLLLTPKQVEEVLARRDALVRTALRRGEQRALTLP